ncbi:TIGR01777 family oxidoreductase [Uliginosibacterium flavum]|uniref:TIGR01777 family oxidoreductase n=1 Tax=Uliginosibacterium flavum TaxID=1396831 RepID=A0ABV2TNP7_9RHOO
MNILITGGTGMLGRALCAVLLAEGHQLTVLSRQPAKVAKLCGASVQAFASLDDWRPGVHFDAVINLAGAQILDFPWTEVRKHALWASRITLTEQLTAAIARAERKPSVLLSGSAIGYYGDCGEAPCSDAFAVPNPSAHDFGARLCAAWENAASQATGWGVRVCLLRTGLVLARQGGLLARMRLPFKLGLGARLGDGLQWMSWIHIDDWVGAVLALLRTESACGAFNLTAPQPVRNIEFTTTLGRSLNRPTPFTLPTVLLQLALGQRAYLLLGGQRVLPERLQAISYRFQQPSLPEALRGLA